MKKSLNLIISSGLFLAICTATLYCIGVAYQNGFLIELKLNASILERSFNLTLYSGLIRFLDITLLLTTRLASILICISIIFIIIGFVLLFCHKYLQLKWVKPFLRKFISFIEKRYKPKKKYDTLEKRVYRFLFYTLSFMLIICFFILLLINMEKQGASRAQTIIQTLREPETISEENLITAWVRGETLKLFYLNCGSKFCAGIDPKTRIVYYFPQDQYTFTLEFESNTN